MIPVTVHLAFNPLRTRSQPLAYAAGLETAGQLSWSKLASVIGCCEVQKMDGQFDLSKAVSQHCVKRLQEFIQPEYGMFKSVFGIDVPQDLERLYSLQMKLVNSKKQFEMESGPLWIQHFCPLNSAAVEGGKNLYGRRFIRFAVGGEGQALLYSIDDPESIWIDYDSDGQNLEIQPIRFEEIISEVAN